MNDIEKTQVDNIEAVAEAIANTIEKGGIIQALDQATLMQVLLRLHIEQADISQLKILKSLQGELMRPLLVLVKSL